jgi:hypothetical protein
VADIAANICRYIYRTAVVALCGGCMCFESASKAAAFACFQEGFKTTCFVCDIVDRCARKAEHKAKTKAKKWDYDIIAS